MQVAQLAERRKIADSQQGLIESAAAALASYRTARPGDLYGALWAVLMAPEGEAIPKDIVALAGQQDVWPLPLLRYALGEIDADQVMQATNVPDFSLTTMRAAEAEFYIGLIHLTRDEMDKRVDRFRRLTAEAPVVVRKRQYPALYKHDNRLEVTLGRWLFEG